MEFLPISESFTDYIYASTPKGVLFFFIPFYSLFDARFMYSILSFSLFFCCDLCLHRKYEIQI